MYLGGDGKPQRIGLMDTEMALEVQLVRTINHIKVFETYLSRLKDDQSRTG